jgi:hypothetical protein
MRFHLCGSRRLRLGLKRSDPLDSYGFGHLNDCSVDRFNARGLGQLDSCSLDTRKHEAVDDDPPRNPRRSLSEERNYGFDFGDRYQ